MDATRCSLSANPDGAVAAHTPQRDTSQRRIAPEQNPVPLASDTAAAADEPLIVERARKGDRDAFRELFDRYHRRVYAHAVSVLRNESDAEEIVQEVFVRVHKSLAEFQGGSAFYTWVFRITHNLCLDQMRRKSRKGGEEFDETIADDVPIEGEDLLPSWLGSNPLAALERKELVARMSQALDALSPKHREILVLREVEGLTYEEIAETLQIQKGTVMSRLFHARKNLQDALASYLAGGDNAGAAQNGSPG